MFRQSSLRLATALALTLPAAHAWADSGRDFPEGIIIDEPGIDDVALLPLNRATGRHIGAVLQFNYFFSGRLGDPLFE